MTRNVPPTPDRDRRPAIGGWQPVAEVRVLASFDMPAVALAVDSENVYWAAGFLNWNHETASPWAMVMQCPKAGCDAPTVLATGTDMPGGIATDGAAVYWVSGDGTSLARCTLGGCGGAPQVVAVGGLWDVVRSSSGATWSVGGPPAASGAFVTDATTAAWVDPAHRLMACPLTGCSGSPSYGGGVSDDFWGSHIAVDSDHIYWHQGDAIVACSKVACSQPHVVSTRNGNLGMVMDLVSDGVNLYWLEQYNAVWRVPVEGGTASLLYYGDEATRITVDDQYLYVAVGDPWGLCGHGACSSGQIVRLLK